ncbi:MAG: class I SAM-dependent methyltransferase, partial [Kiritimatiellae bacterium]|nr:class I SAM-dependent methyltransferase [Kiritimatiellia bacterium]
MKSERSSFWKLQAEWHGNIDPSAVLDRHRIREKYYDWYTQNWLIDDKARPVLDLACGAGGFVYFLTQRGYSNVVGIDLDEVQVAVASGLGLDCRCEGISDHLAGVKEGACGLISALDILEHFTSEELSDTLDAISKAL